MAGPGLRGRFEAADIGVRRSPGADGRDLCPDGNERSGNGDRLTGDLPKAGLAQQPLRRAVGVAALEEPVPGTAEQPLDPGHEPGAGGGQAGDLYLRIRQAPHPRFERKGRDLYTRVPIPLTTAVLGGEAEVRTLGGKSLRLKIPPTTQNAQVFRLKGHGMPVPGKPDEQGDLYATVDVQLPKQVTPEERAHYEALQKLEAGTKNSAA